MTSPLRGPGRRGRVAPSPPSDRPRVTRWLIHIGPYPTVVVRALCPPAHLLDELAWSARAGGFRVQGADPWSVTAVRGSRVVAFLLDFFDLPGSTTFSRAELVASLLPSPRPDEAVLRVTCTVGRRSVSTGRRVAGVVDRVVGRAAAAGIPVHVEGWSGRPDEAPAPE